MESEWWIKPESGHPRPGTLCGGQATLASWWSSGSDGKTGEAGLHSWGAQLCWLYPKEGKGDICSSSYPITHDWLATCSSPSWVNVQETENSDWPIKYHKRQRGIILTCSLICLLQEVSCQVIYCLWRGPYDKELRISTNNNLSGLGIKIL